MKASCLSPMLLVICGGGWCVHLWPAATWRISFKRMAEVALAVNISKSMATVAYSTSSKSSPNAPRRPGDNWQAA